MSYAWTIPAFGATPTVATEAERQAVILANDRATVAHRTEVARWEALVAQYGRDQASYLEKLRQQEASYAAAMRAYESALAAARARAAGEQSNWAAQSAAWGAQKRARDNLIAQNQTNAQRVLGNNPPPPGFVTAGYCATQAQVDQWRNYCAPVRGLGANEPYCVWQNLAVCSVPIIGLPPVPPPPVAMPTPPVRPTAPRAPSPPPPQPPPPRLAEVPTVVAPPPRKPPLRPDGPMTVVPQPPPPRTVVTRPTPELPPPPEVPAKQQNLVVFGILALVVAGGAGGAYWYAKRKKKPVAA